VAMLDITANNALKFRPAETLRWLVPNLDPDYDFTRWAETRLRAPPGQRGRLCDTAAALASRIWAEWLGRDTIWKKALEELDVWHSKLLQERIDQARAEERLKAQRTFVLQALQTRFPQGLLADLEQRLQEITDFDILSRWFQWALEAVSLDEFRRLLVQTPTNGTGQGAP
jgi:hypothetical protein